MKIDNHIESNSISGDFVTVLEVSQFLLEENLEDFLDDESCVSMAGTFSDEDDEDDGLTEEIGRLDELGRVLQHEMKKIDSLPAVPSETKFTNRLKKNELKTPKKYVDKSCSQKCIVLPGNTNTYITIHLKLSDHSRASSKWKRLIVYLLAMCTIVSQSLMMQSSTAVRSWLSLPRQVFTQSEDQQLVPPTSFLKELAHNELQLKSRRVLEGAKTLTFDSLDTYASTRYSQCYYDPQSFVPWTRDCVRVIPSHLFAFYIFSWRWRRLKTPSQ